MKHNHNKYIQYKRDIMAIDERSAAEHEKSVLDMIDSGVSKTQITALTGTSLDDVDEIVGGRSD